VALRRLAAQIALHGLITRFPGLRLAEGRKISYPANLSFRGPEALWVRANSKRVAR
jgi:hypothetical protein